jgi:long-subunit acyl-CoA synthetase (AMP-forming)
MLLDRIKAHAASDPAATAITWGDGQLTYRQLQERVQEAMAWLEAEAVDALALDLENGPDWVVLDIAALAMRKCVVPLPRFFSAEQLRHAITSTGVDVIISDRPGSLPVALADLLNDASRGLAFCRTPHTVLRTTTDAVQRNAKGCLAGADKVTFTSGTTGSPKGARLTWAQMRSVTVSLVDAAEMTAGDRHLATMPLAVLLENIAGIYAPLWAGARVTLSAMPDIGIRGAAGVDGRVLADALAGHAATTAIFTPQTLQAVVEALEYSDVDVPDLRFAAVGGAPVSSRLLSRAADLGLPVYEGYGLSECSSVVCLNTPSHNRPGSVGRPLPHVDLAIADDGEVIVRNSRFTGYVGQPAGDAMTWRTGDVGELDADGFLYLRGRRRNVFITAFGRNVAPEWVERELTLESPIFQAAVFGEARPFNVAVIAASEGATMAQVEAAVERVNRDLPDYARVSRWVHAATPFSPANGLLTGTGRVRRRQVYQHHRDAIESLYQEVVLT